MGLISDENVKLPDVSFFKVDQRTYDPATETWESDWLVKDNSTLTVTIPSNIEPGTYVVRHEILALHFAFTENKTLEKSGAQFYPTCVKVKVTGSGKDSPPGVKFPGGYRWNEAGLLDNIYYGPNQYVSNLHVIDGTAYLDSKC
jgi:lytic cellulose monooxygenase (C1-hydroxylating)